MTQAVIDTLRLADRLKEAGFQDRQAEGAARALGGEFAEHVITRPDLDSAINLVRSDYRALHAKVDALDEKFDAKFDSLDARIDALDGKFDAKFDALDGKFDAKFDSLGARINTLDGKFEAKFDSLGARINALDGKFDAKFNALGTQIRFIFAILAILLALGLIETATMLSG